MKYFMQYRSEVAGSVDLPQEQRLALLHNNSNIKELRYMLSMVDMLSTCAEVIAVPCGVFFWKYNLYVSPIESAQILDQCLFLVLQTKY